MIKESIKVTLLILLAAMLLGIMTIIIFNKKIFSFDFKREELLLSKDYSIEEVNKIEIDVWPLIPPYIEIEGSNVDSIYDIAKKLGYSRDKTCIMNTEDIYLDNGINLNDYEILTFKEFYKYKN